MPAELLVPGVGMGKLVLAGMGKEVDFGKEDEGLLLGADDC